MHAQLMRFCSRGTITALTRRHALLALSAAAFGAHVTRHTGVAARKNAKQKATKARKSFRKRCNHQKALCRAKAVGEPTPPACCASCFTDDYIRCWLQIDP